MALPPQIKSKSSHDLHPVRPTIRTTKANGAVGDWGLKRSLPRLKTQNITVMDIDTQEHQTPFKSSNQHTKFVERWQELGLPITPAPISKDYTKNIQYAGSSPDKVNKGIHLTTLPRNQTKYLINRARRERSKFLHSHQIKDVVYTHDALSKARRAGDAHLGISAERPFAVQFNGGLGHHPHGALSLINTPQGAREKQAKARLMQSGRSRTLVGLGGIIAEVPNSDIRYSSRETTLTVYPQNVSFNNDGALKISLSTHRPNTFDDRKRDPTSAYNNIFSFSSDKGFEDDEMELVDKEVIPSLDRLLRSSPTFGQSRKKQ